MACYITDNNGTVPHAGPMGAGTTDIGGRAYKLKPCIKETADDSGEVPAAAIRLGAPAPDAESERIVAHLGTIIPEVKMAFQSGSIQ